MSKVSTNSINPDNIPINDCFCTLQRGPKTYTWRNDKIRLKKYLQTSEICNNMQLHINPFSWCLVIEKIMNTVTYLTGAFVHRLFFALLKI